MSPFQKMVQAHTLVSLGVAGSGLCNFWGSQVLDLVISLGGQSPVQNSVVFMDFGTQGNKGMGRRKVKALNVVLFSPYSVFWFNIYLFLHPGQSKIYQDYLVNICLSVCFYATHSYSPSSSSPLKVQSDKN